MEKIVTKVSIKSKLINKLLIFMGYKKRYANERNIKKWLNQANYKRKISI